VPEPRIQFLIGGVQKGGTTALAHCLAQHPRVLLPDGKEAHVFDAPDFNDSDDRAAVDARYAPHFAAADDSSAHLCGDATPIYCLHERFIQRIARYNPQMRWLLLLRDPVERAISQYHMERTRGDEHWPLLPALLLERWRLHGHHDDFSPGSPLRHHSYRLRGDYARQLDALYRHFPREQVLLLRSDAFRHSPQEIMARVYAHLGLAGPVRLPARTEAFAGDYTPPSGGSPTMTVARWLLRAERRRLRRGHGIVFE
jgi:hypothetical protein